MRVRRKRSREVWFAMRRSFPRASVFHPDGVSPPRHGRGQECAATIPGVPRRCGMRAKKTSSAERENWAARGDIERLARNRRATLTDCRDH